MAFLPMGRSPARDASGGRGAPPRPAVLARAVHVQTEATAEAGARVGVPARAAAPLALVAADALGHAAAAGLVVAAAGAGPELWRILILAALAVLAGHAAEGLYPGYRIHGHERLRRRVRTTLRVAALGCLGAVVLDAAALAPPVAAFLALSLAAQLGLRWAAGALLRRVGLWGEPATILAGLERAPALCDYFERNWHLGVRPVPPGAPGARLALLAADAVPLGDELDRLRVRHRELVLLADIPPLQINGLRPRDLRGEIGVRLSGAPPGRLGDAGRRACDLALALASGVVAVPLMLAAALAIYLVDPGPVLYAQRREGLRGRTVRVLKLRTMFRDAEARLDALLECDPHARAEWAARFKLRRDPRILPVVGGFLRSSSLDELPQLWNVIAGDMCIVGPRPFPDYHVDAMSPEFRAKRCSIVPGLTGLWQISDRSDADLETARQLDEFYVDNRSFWLDASIVLGTVSAVLGRRGV